MSWAALEAGFVGGALGTTTVLAVVVALLAGVRRHLVSRVRR